MHASVWMHSGQSALKGDGLLPGRVTEARAAYLGDNGKENRSWYENEPIQRLWKGANSKCYNYYLMLSSWSTLLLCYVKPFQQKLNKVLHLIFLPSAQ